MGRLISPARRSPLLPASAVLIAVAIGILLPSARTSGVAIGAGALALMPLGALVFGGALRAATITAALAYAGALVWSYTGHFAPLFAYQGIVDAGPDPPEQVVVVALAALPVAWLPLSSQRPSTIVLWFIYLTGYVPTIVVPLFITGELQAVLGLDVLLIAAMAIVGLMVRLPPAPIEVPHLSLTTFTQLLTGLGLLTTLYVAVTFGISSPPSLGEVYSTRAEFSDALGGAMIGAYLVPWAGHAINPILMALGLSRRRIDLLTLGLAGQLLIYADTGLKSILFSIALVPFVYFAISKAGHSFGLLAVAVAPVILVWSVLAEALTAQWSLALARRTFATPGQVSYYYFEYFSDHARYHLSHSFLSWLGPSPYARDPALLIGEVYFPQWSPNANASMWADAFANFGSVGILGFTVILGFLLLLVDGLGRRRDVRVIGPMLAIAGLGLAESGLFTMFVTLGFGVGCVLVAVMPPGQTR